MKTKHASNIATGIILMLFLSSLKICSQTNNTSLNPKDFPYIDTYGSGGSKVFPRWTTNYFPIVFCSGEDIQRERGYADDPLLQPQSVPEILPAEQDPNGNWGLPADKLQLSVRFGQQKYEPSDLVPVRIILRNLDSTRRIWIRNTLPDQSYQFTLHHGTNTTTWLRPKQKHVTEFETLNRYLSGLADTGDCHAFHYVAEAKSEGLTKISINRFF